MKRIIVVLLALVALSYFSVSPLFERGYFTMHDDTQIARVSEMKNSLLDGMFPVRWVENLGYGYGYPIFNFYAPLPYYIGAFFDIAGFDSITATKLMFGIGTVLSVFTMYLLLKRFFDTFTAIAGSIVYLYFPYHAVNIYIRAAVGEYYAYAFMPLVFLALFSLYDVFQKGRKLPLPLIILLSVGIFLVTISHNLSAFMMFVMIALFTVISLITAKNKKGYILSIAIGFFLGLGLSAFYFIPAVLESGYTDVSSQVGGGADYKDHFVCISQYWNSMWGFGGSVPGCLDGVSFKLGKQNILLLALSLVVALYIYIRKRKINNLFVINVGLLLSAFLLTLSISKPIWDITPFMSFLQFPWRFINFIALFLSFTVGYFLFKTEKLFGRVPYIVGVIAVIGVTIALNGKLFAPQFTTNEPESHYTNPGTIQFGTSRISDEYLPKGFKEPSDIDDLPKALFSSEFAEFKNINKKTDLITAEYTSPTDTSVHINIAYYPAWEVYVKDRKVDVTPDSEGMNFTVPQGSGEVRVTYSQTFPAIVGNIVTIGSFLAIIAGIILRRGKKRG